MVIRAKQMGLRLGAYGNVGPREVLPKKFVKEQPEWVNRLLGRGLAEKVAKPKKVAPVVAPEAAEAEVAPAAAPEPEAGSRYMVKKGGGWYTVFEADGSVVGDGSCRKAEAEALIAAGP